MARSIIKITVNEPLQNADAFGFNDGFAFLEIEFRSPQTSGFILPSGSAQTDALNISNRLKSQYNITNKYIITKDLNNNTVILEDNVGNLQFFEGFNLTNGRVSFEIINQPVITPLQITDFVISEDATDPCNFYNVEITTNTQATQLLQPQSIAITENPFNLRVDRNDVNTKNFEVTNGETIALLSDVYTPKLLEVNFNVDTVNDLTGDYTITINRKNTTPFNSNFELEYSLDGVDYFTSNSFSSVEAGTQTIYIRDNIGCSINFDIVLEGLDVFQREPIFYVSEQNSLITVLRDNKLPNITNTLSYEEEVQVNECDFKQLFQNNDGVLTQQFATSYDNVTVKLIDCAGNESLIIPEQKTNNFNITDLRDVTVTNYDYLGRNYVAISYGSGNTYDPDTLVKNGEYFLGSLVPSFMNEGDGISIEGFSQGIEVSGTYRVQDVLFDNEINQQVLVLDVLNSDFPVSPNGFIARGATRYNALNYNYYEFNIDLSTLNGDYYITYEVTDSEFETIEAITEIFNVSEKQEDTVLFKYYNTVVNQTLYSTGIQYFIRIPIDEQIKYLPKQTKETFDTDTNSILVEGTHQDALTVTTQRIPTNLAKKISTISINDRVSINDLPVIFSEEIEIEAITGTNLYNVTFELKRSNEVLSNTNTIDGSVILPSGNALNIGNDGAGFLLVN